MSRSARLIENVGYSLEEMAPGANFFSGELFEYGAEEILSLLSHSREKALTFGGEQYEFFSSGTRNFYYVDKPEGRSGHCPQRFRDSRATDLKSCRDVLLNVLAAHVLPLPFGTDQPHDSHLLAGELSAAERFFERQQGLSLLCCAYPESDVSIELWDYDEADLQSSVTVQQFEAEVEQITPLTHDIRGIHLRLITPERMEFKAGQYIDLLVPGTSEWRSYSMANPPSQNGTVEMMVKLMPGGLFSSYVEHQLQPGARLTLQGPYGNFHLRDTQHEAIFIAGGSGMAPILSLLRDMTNRQDSRSVTYFYGARTRRDLFQLEELRGFEQRLPHFRFVPALSEPQPGDAWDGETGLITEVVKRIVSTGTNQEAYMCGPTAMIDAAIMTLQRLGVEEQAIFYDKFVTKADTVR